MKSVTVTPDQFEKAVFKALSEYGDGVLKKSDAVAKQSARQTTSELKSTAPTGGSYAKGWSHRAMNDGAWGKRQAVYNRTDYQLIHLLEKPHATGHGGHYPNKVDYTGTLARIEEEQTQKFMEEVISRL